jgi:hypothetical protein
MRPDHDDWLWLLYTLLVGASMLAAHVAFITLRQFAVADLIPRNSQHGIPTS